VQLEEVRLQVDSLRPEGKAVEVMEQRIQTLAAQTNYNLSPAEILYELSAVIGQGGAGLDGLYLDELTYSADGQVVISGHSRGEITPWRFAELLSSTGIWEQVDPPKIEFRQYGTTRLLRFSLATIVGEGS